MSKVKLDAQHLSFMSLFDRFTRVSCKDCVEEGDRLVFVVSENQASKAVGRSGANVRRLEKALKRKLKIVEYRPDVTEFTKNLVYPLKVTDITEEEGIVTITPADHQTRGLLIGRNACYLRATEEVIKRHFPIIELKVV